MATAVSYALRSISVYEEPSGSFATDHYSTAGDFLEVPAETAGMTFTPAQPMVDPATLQQLKHGRSTKLLGPRSATLAFTVPLAMTGILAGESTSTADEDDNALLRLLKIVLGGITSSAAGSSVATASTASSFTVDSGEGANFSVGGACGWINAAGLMEVREIKSISTDTITVKHAFSGSPASSDVIYNATTLYLDDGGSHAQFRAIGKDANDAWSIRGCQLQSIAFRLGLGAIPAVTFTFQCAEWENKGGGSLAGVTYSNYSPYPFNVGELLVQTPGTVTRNVVCGREMTITSGLTYVAKTCFNGINTIDGYVQQHTPSVVGGTFNVHYEDQTWFTARSTPTLKSIALQVGMLAGGGWLLSVPNAQITDVTPPQDGNSLAVQTVTFEGGLDSDTGGTSTALLRSPFRMHLVG